MSQLRPRIAKLRRAALGAAGIGVLVAGGALPAAAHVTATASETGAGSHTVVTLSVPHGCDGSATTRVAVQIPEPITDVTPTRHPLYEVTTVSEELEDPVDDGHGGFHTSRVTQVIFEAQTPLPDNQRDTFELGMALPENAAGTTLYFPAVQTCESGENAWIEIPGEDQDPHELDFPAPAITVTAPAADSSGSTASASFGAVALVMATLALGLGIFGLMRRRS